MSTPEERAAELAAELKADRAARKAGKAAQATPSTGTPAGAQPYNETNPGHRLMAQAADRFVRHSMNSRHVRGAIDEAEKARAHYWNARKTHGAVQDLEGPCAKGGCPSTHAEGKPYCGGGSCTSPRKMGEGLSRKTTDVSGYAGSETIPSTTREKAGPEGRGFGADAGFTAHRREIK